MRYIVKFVFGVGLVIKHFSSPICLDKQVSAGKQPGQGEQVGGEGGREDIQSNWGALRWEEFICRVVLDGMSDSYK